MSAFGVEEDVELRKLLKLQSRTLTDFLYNQGEPSMAEALQFNIVDSHSRLLCPCCGYPGYSNVPAYDKSGGIIGLCICPCCLWEPGFDDDQMASAEANQTILESLIAYRQRWVGLKKWRGKPEIRPIDWHPETQLEQLYNAAPHVRS